MARKRAPGARLDLDAIDRAILAALQRNGRMTYRELAVGTGLSPRATLARVRRLEESGIISGYVARLDPALLGHAVVALAQLELRQAAGASRQRLERVLTRAPEVVELMVVSGEADYLARVAVPSLGDYEVLTGAWLSDPSLGIARITTTFVLRTLKDFAGYMVPEENQGDRK